MADNNFGFIIYPVIGDLSAIPTIGHFVPIDEDNCAALGNHDSEENGKNMIVTEFLGYHPDGTDIYEDIYINTGS
ncbi:unnamed protein product [marine sediment metagenome]|uniref:Uncharacterized protein n=1 Tax=marine sediment metagenome TaxID=412755 RepID=X0SP72_9ZZZZ